MPVYYRFTAAGRALTLSQWLRIGGCGIPGWEEAAIKSHVAKLNGSWATVLQMTLGELTDIAPGIERHLARFAWDHLADGTLAVPRDMTIDPFTNRPTGGLG